MLSAALAGIAVGMFAAWGAMRAVLRRPGRVRPLAGAGLAALLAAGADDGEAPWWPSFERELRRYAQARARP